MIQNNRIYQTHHENQFWVRFAMLFLGFWLLIAPQTFGYVDSTALKWSDWISGILLIFFGFFSMSYSRRGWIWGVCAVGLWLQLAPLLFWAYPAVIYLNDTVIGLLAISFCILVPIRPKELDLGPEIPPGWTYNPSSWQQRIPVIFLAVVGWFAARYLGSYELHYTSSVWDPFFGNGTEKVLTSDLSKSFPVADASLGAIAYSLEAILGAKGSTKRWHTMPWIVVFFGILVVPVGFVSILLVMMQPIVVGYWCGLCLIIAACMLLMLALTVDEVLAVLQFLKMSKRAGKPLMKTFWLGSNYTQNDVDPRTPSFLHAPEKNVKSMFWGVNFRWNLCVTALLGIWFLFATHHLGYEGALSNSNDVCAALIVTLSIISFAEVIRALRLINILIAIWVGISPWILNGVTNPTAPWHSVIFALLMILFSIPRGPIREHYGAWDKKIF